jgi:hypothetical protein
LIIGGKSTYNSLGARDEGIRKWVFRKMGQELIQECRVITHYLAGQAPSSDLIQRYLEANTALLARIHSPSDQAIVSFVRRNPWALPYLDATLAVVRRDSLLRHKILVMIAILEATPEFVHLFLHEPVSILRFFWRMTGYGASSMLRLMVGCILYPFVTKMKYDR